MWVAAERPPRTRAARLFVFSRTCVIISKPVTPCKTFRGNMAEFFNRLLGTSVTLISNDGVNWSKEIWSALLPQTVAYGNGHFLGVDFVGLLSSSDGVSWDFQSLASGFGNMALIRY